MFEKSPDYLVLGHVTRDLLPGGSYTAGGTALYSAMTAQRLGVQAAIVTSCSPTDDALLDAARKEGIWIERIASPVTTSFSNYYDRWGNRTQVIGGQAGMLKYEDVPPEWLDARVVHLGPVAQELPDGIARQFANAQLLGITPQGWMRQWDGQGNVRQSSSPIPAGLQSVPSNAFLVVSMEDLGHRPDRKRDYINVAPLVAVTGGPEEAELCHRGSCFRVPALGADIVDLTGAGDVFAAALFVRYLETMDLATAARFAHSAAALNIEGRGLQGVPNRSQVEQRLQQAEHEA